MQLNFEQNISLIPYSTFRLEATARFCVKITCVEDLQHLMQNEHFMQYPHIMIGGGSNIVFCKDYDGLIILNNICGITILEDTETHCVVSCGGGELWQTLVDFSLSHNLGGVENLTLIPGTIGASPVQNIGAYGQEVQETIQSVEYFDFEARIVKTLTNAECQFGYRSSIFKTMFAGQGCVISVVFMLAKNPQPNLSYAPVAEQFAGQKEPVTIRQVSEAIANIRRSKLPDSQMIANCGSFFKNPVVSTEVYSNLNILHPDIPGFMQVDGKIKIPGAWLIEHAGWKDKRIGDIGTYPTQPLVLVNYGSAKAEELFAFVDALQNDVFAKFGVFLEPEVNIV